MERKKFDLVISWGIIDELIKVLKNFKIQIDNNLIQEVINIILENSILIKISGKLKVVEKDPSDNKFIETAINGKADYIITQDKHLLDIKEYKNIKIINPKEFLNILAHN